MVKKDPDNLDALLHSWSELPAPTQRLAAPVWQRIEACGASLSWAAGAVDWLREIDARIARPQVMAALVVVALLLGAGLAEMRTRSAVARVDAEMSARYLAMLDLAGR